MEIIKAEKNRIEYLDSLRGLAAVSVIISHFVLAYRLDLEFKLVNYSPLHFFFDGFAAVTLFFILSGYVLTLSLDKYKHLNITGFYLKRIFRIMPAYLVVFGLSFIGYTFYKIVLTVPPSSFWINDFWSKRLPVDQLFKQAFFTPPPDSVAKLVPQNWTLYEEMVFSALMPFLYLIIKKGNTLFLLIINLILYAFFKVEVFIMHFSLGIFLALHQKKLVELFQVYRNKYKILVILLIWFLYSYRYTLPMYYYYHFRKMSPLLSNEDLTWAIVGIGAFLLLVYSLSSTKFQNLLSKKFLRFLGQLSYAIYLTHFMVLIFIVPLFIKFINTIGIVNKYLIWFSSLSILLIVTIGISYFLATFVEMPIAAKGNALIKRIKIKNI